MNSSLDFRKLRQRVETFFAKTPFRKNLPLSVNDCLNSNEMEGYTMARDYNPDLAELVRTVLSEMQVKFQFDERSGVV